MSLYVKSDNNDYGTATYSNFIKWYLELSGNYVSDLFVNGALCMESRLKSKNTEILMH